MFSKLFILDGQSLQQYLQIFSVVKNLHKSNLAIKQNKLSHCPM